MHICYITGEYPIPGHPHGGIGTFIKSIAENLTQKNIKVSVITSSLPHQPDEVRQQGSLTIYSMKRSNWPVLKFIDYAIRQNRLLRKINYDTPVDLLEGSEIAFANIRKIKKICYVIRMHGGHHFFAEAEKRAINKKTALLEKKSFSKADALIAVSQYVNTNTAKHLGFNPQKTAIIFNGIDINKWKASTSSKIIPGRILFAGTVCEKKGIRQLIMALPAVKAQYPHAHLVVAGGLTSRIKGTDQLYIDFLQDFIDPTVKDSINFLGFVNNQQIPDYLETAEICVYPSHMEAMPLAWLEVLASEKLLICGKTGPGPEVIDDKITGLLCDPHSPEDIAEKVIYALSHQEECRKMAKKAREVAIERYDAEKLVQVNIDFYTKAITNHKASLNK